MRRLFLATAIALVAACTTPSYGSDAPGKPGTRVGETATALFSWDGLYLGAHAGYSFLDTSGSIGPLGGPAGPSFGYGGDRDGWLYGGHVGAQRQLGALVLGVEGSIAKANIKGTSSVGGIALPPGSSLNTSYDIAWIGIAEVKAGIAMNRWLPFATAGAACAQGKAGIAFTSPGPAFAATSSDEWNCGWTLGAGLDFAVTENVIATLKYNYADFGSATPCFGIVGGVCAGGPLDITAHIARGGLSLKF